MLAEVVKSLASNGVRMPLSMALCITDLGAGGVSTFVKEPFRRIKREREREMYTQKVITMHMRMTMYVRYKQHAYRHSLNSQTVHIN